MHPAHLRFVPHGEQLDLEMLPHHIVSEHESPGFPTAVFSRYPGSLDDQVTETDSDAVDGVVGYVLEADPEVCPGVWRETNRR